jgi:hypothetical protein
MPQPDHKPAKPPKADKTIKFKIDAEKFETTEQSLSVRSLIEDYAKVDAASNTLALLNGNVQHRYENLDEVVPLKNGMKFVVLSDKPTPVS